MAFIPSIISIAGVRLTGLVAVAGKAGGGGGGSVLTFGGNMNQVGRFAAVNGTVAVPDVNGLNPASQAISPARGSTLVLAWNTLGADGTTVFKVNLNGLTVATTIAGTALGFAAFPGVIVEPGDLVAIEFDTGTDPSASTFTIIIV